MGWFLTLFAHTIADNEALFLVWDFLLSIQIKKKSEKDANSTHYSIGDKVEQRQKSGKYLSLQNNSLNENSFNSTNEEPIVVQGSMCEFVVAQIIAFHLHRREIDNKLSEDQLLMVIKQIDLNALSISDYRVILSKSAKLIQLYYPEMV